MRLAIDASAGLYTAASRRGFMALARHQLAAPALFWSEAASSLRETVYRGLLDVEEADRALEALLAAPIERHTEDALYRRATVIARRLGWAKTYDAEYLAVAEALGVPLLTRDARLARRAASLVPIVSPEQLEA